MAAVWDATQRSWTLTLWSERATSAHVVIADDKAVTDDSQQAASKDVKTISGKSACATCDGVTDAGHNIMLVDGKGMRWVLVGKGEDLDVAGNP